MVFLLTFSYWLLYGSFFKEKDSNTFLNETSNLTLKLTEYNESNVPLEVNGIEYLIMIWAFLYFFQIIREVFSLFYMFHLLLYK